MDGLFITGTDTGVGKTHVTAAIARTLRSRGQSVIALKPIATGCRLEGDRWLSDDTSILAEACGADLREVTRWSFPEPVAPCVAARLHGVDWSIRDLTDEVLRHAAADRLVIVEGVGGLLCPVTDRETVADWITCLKIPTIVVARRSLGTLNHTLMTLEVARGRGIDVRGVVVNEIAPPEGLAEATNIDELRRRIDVPILAVSSYHQPVSPYAVLDGVDWQSLMRSCE